MPELAPMPDVPAIDLDLCLPFDFVCAGKNAASIIGSVGRAAGNTVMKSWADAVFETLTDTLVRIGTFWVGVDTPSLTGTDSEVGFVTGHLTVLTLAVVTVSVIAAGIQLATGHSGRPFRDLVTGILTFMTVAIAGAATCQLLVSAADSFSEWIISEATGDVGSNFAFSLFQGGLIAGQYAGTLAPVLIILLGLFGIIANVVQIGMMMLRSAFLIILAAVLPISAAGSNTPWGKGWFQKNVTWLMAFILYKPAAAIVYAVAIKLTSRDGFADQWSSDDVTTFIMGILLLIAAVLVLPALIGFIVPASAAMSQGGPGVGDTAVMGAMATGSVMSMHSSHTASVHSGGAGASSPSPAGGGGAAGSSSSTPAPASSPAPTHGGGASVSSGVSAGAPASAGGGAAGGAASGGAAAAGATAATGGVAAVVMAGAQIGSGVTSAASEAATGAAGGIQA
ncbi:MAG: hypothetical protein SOX57_07430 [Schaalia hyovaginalis]|uniref:hypothetical protein n=1 Tax=Schaalia hyovaginalis TaxID=29316 RepID=UPI002A8235FF|nr:hypothetical protein [Schaalia hyovaginalis]MDY3666335.1 hypothetical protein [Schaalia hyovaginalis]MDY4263146.1 hypothetical protein [Schaalia hyovaginalis]